MIIPVPVLKRRSQRLADYNRFNKFPNNKGSDKSNNWPVAVFIGIIVLVFVITGVSEFVKKKRNEAAEEEKKKYCIIGGCENIKYGGTDYCYDHICHLQNCLNLRMADSDYCLIHAYDYDENYKKRLKERQDEYAKKNEETTESLKKKVPYVGMKAEYLSATSLGTAYFNGTNSTTVNGKRKSRDIYYYFSGKDVIYTALVIDGKVSSVSDYRDNPWKNQLASKKKPYSNKTVSSANSAKNNSISENTKPSDIYETEKYNSADDFADEWEDDFDNWGDAYDYWEEVME